MKLQTLTATILAAMLSTAAHAQSGDTTTGPKVGAGTTEDATMGTAPDSTMNFGQIVSDLNNGTIDASTWATDLALIDDSATVQIVTLSELKGSAAENAEGLDNALAGLQPDIDAARAEIEANTELMAALEAQAFGADDVVAVDVEGTSDVVLIVDDVS